MGACFEVYKELGSGYLEAVYQECLEIEFGLQDIPARPQVGLAPARTRADASRRSTFLTSSAATRSSWS